MLPLVLTELPTMVAVPPVPVPVAFWLRVNVVAFGTAETYDPAGMFGPVTI